MQYAQIALRGIHMLHRQSRGRNLNGGGGGLLPNIYRYTYFISYPNVVVKVVGMEWEQEVKNP